MADRLLVTGATGFLGTALIRRLAECRGGAAVRAAVRAPGARLPDGVDEIVIGDLAEGVDWTPALDGVSCVVHLAARVHVLRDDTDRALTMSRQVNTDATLRLAEHAATSGARRFVFLSTIKVNGESTPADRPFTERDDPVALEGDEPYARSKAEAERGLRDVGARTGMEIVIIRPPLVYGPGAKANFAKLLRVIRFGVPLPLGAVENSRSFVALDNLVDFIVTCIEHPAAANETFLVSDGVDLSTPELVRRLARAMGRRARLLSVPPSMLVAVARLIGRPGIAQRLLSSLRVDSSKARRTLGWAPPVTVDEGLAKAIVPFTRAKG